MIQEDLGALKVVPTILLHDYSTQLSNKKRAAAALCSIEAPLHGFSWFR